jgi:hypothetical protein
MRLLWFALLCLLGFGCIGGPWGSGGGNLTSGRNLTYSQLKPFFDAGCVNESPGYLQCDNASFVRTFGCFQGSHAQIMNEGAGLEPQLALVRCPIEVYGSNLSNEQMEDYFFCGGGMLRTCTSYVLWENGSFIQIKSEGELAARIMPIGSEEEALDFVLLSKGYGRVVDADEQHLFYATAQGTGSDFLVKAYAPDRVFGCYGEVNYEEIGYLVTPDGNITEKSRKTVYTKILGYQICVD